MFVLTFRCWRWSVYTPMHARTHRPRGLIRPMCGEAAASTPGHREHHSWERAESAAPSFASLSYCRAMNRWKPTFVCMMLQVEAKKEGRNGVGGLTSEGARADGQASKEAGPQKRSQSVSVCLCVCPGGLLGQGKVALLRGIAKPQLYLDGLMPFRYYKDESRRRWSEEG